MNAYIFLVTGMLLLLSGLITAVFIHKSQNQLVSGKTWFRSYITLLAFALVIAMLLSLAGFVERWVSVDAYKILFDMFTFGLMGVLVSGLVLVVRRRGFLASYALCLCGAFLTFGELLGR